MALKDSWKETGSSLGHAFKDLGKSIARTASYSAKKVGEWTNIDKNDEAKEEEENNSESEKTE